MIIPRWAAYVYSVRVVCRRGHSASGCPLQYCGGSHCLPQTSKSVSAAPPTPKLGVPRRLAQSAGLPEQWQRGRTRSAAARARRTSAMPGPRITLAETSSPVSSFKKKPAVAARRQSLAPALMQRVGRRASNEDRRPLQRRRAMPTQGATADDRASIFSQDGVHYSEASNTIRVIDHYLREALACVLARRGRGVLHQEHL